MNLYQQTNQRLKEVVQLFTNGNVSMFARVLNISQQRFDRLLKPNPRTGKYPAIPRDVVQAIFQQYPQLDPVWFLSGHGNQLLDPESQYHKSCERPYYATSFTEALVAFETNAMETCLLNIPLPPFKEADFLCMMMDASMMPEIAQGDIIALKEVKNIEKELAVSQNQIYGVVGPEIRLIRRIGPDERQGIPRSIILYTKNIGSEFPKKSLACDKIERMFKVLGCVKKI